MIASVVIVESIEMMVLVVGEVVVGVGVERWWRAVAPEMVWVWAVGAVLTQGDAGSGLHGPDGSCVVLCKVGLVS